MGRSLWLYGCGEAECLNDTGGSCKLFGCSKSRGPTDCTDGKCLCQEGSCVQDGACVAGEDKSDNDEKSDSDSDSDSDDEIMQVTEEQLANRSLVMSAAMGFVFGSMTVGIAFALRRRTVSLSDEPFLGM